MMLAMSNLPKVRIAWFMIKCVNSASVLVPLNIKPHSYISTQHIMAVTYVSVVSIDPSVLLKALPPVCMKYTA